MLPEGYKIKDNALYFLKPGKGESTDVLLCNFIPYVVSEIILDSGGKTDRAYEIEGIDKNGCLLPRITIAENPTSTPRAACVMCCRRQPTGPSANVITSRQVGGN